MNWREIVPISLVFILGVLVGAIAPVPEMDGEVERRVQLQRDSIHQLEIIELELRNDRDQKAQQIDSLQTEYEILEHKYAALYEDFVDINVRVRDLGHDTLVSSIRHWIREDQRGKRGARVFHNR